MNVNLTRFVNSGLSSKCIQVNISFYDAYEVNFTIFTPISASKNKQLLLSKRVFKESFNEDISVW